MDDVRRDLAAAPASGIVERMCHHIRRLFDCTDVDLLLVDYRLATLIPLLGARTAFLGTGQGGPAWRCFDRQQPVADETGVFVPVSVRGDRLGVLRLAPVPGATERIDEVAALGSLLGHEIASAGSTTDRYLVGARTQRLTLAAEMQWELLPGRSCAATQFNLAGQLEPAYSVRGDTFDWSVDVDRLTIAVLDGMSEGVAAASLSVLATSALRNARRAGLGVVDQASLADDALFAQHRGSQYVSVLLLEIDLNTGRVIAVDAGSPVLLLVRGEELTDIRLATNDPLGMFEGSRFTAQDFDLEPGDRLVILSDGIHAAQHGDRRYEQTDLRRLVRRTRGLSPLDMVRTTVNELVAFTEGQLTDDAAAVCLDWRGARPLE
jgi:Stage II sporulation protein E (SpoIIE)